MLVPPNSPSQLVVKFHTAASAHPHVWGCELKTHCKVFLGYSEKKPLNESHQLVGKASELPWRPGQLLNAVISIAGDPNRKSLLFSY